MVVLFLSVRIQFSLQCQLRFTFSAQLFTTSNYGISWLPTFFYVSLILNLTCRVFLNIAAARSRHMHVLWDSVKFRWWYTHSPCKLVYCLNFIDFDMPSYGEFVKLSSPIICAKNILIIRFLLEICLTSLHLGEGTQIKRT